MAACMYSHDFSPASFVFAFWLLILPQRKASMVALGLKGTGTQIQNSTKVIEQTKLSTMYLSS